MFLSVWGLIIDFNPIKLANLTFECLCFLLGHLNTILEPSSSSSPIIKPHFAIVFYNKVYLCLQRLCRSLLRLYILLWSRYFMCWWEANSNTWFVGPLCTEPNISFEFAPIPIPHPSATTYAHPCYSNCTHVLKKCNITNNIVPMPTHGQ